MERLTLQDELWLASSLPFLMFGASNVEAYAPRPNPNQNRKHYFQRVGSALWLVHLALVKSGDISLAESRAVINEFENYIVNSIKK